MSSPAAAVKPVSSIPKRKKRTVLHNALIATLVLWLMLVFFRRQRDSSETKLALSYYSWILGQEDDTQIRSLVLSKSRLPRPLHVVDEAAASKGSLSSMNKTRAQAKPNTVTCDFSHFRTDVCYLEGDVRVKGNSVTLLRSHENNASLVAKIKPYTRKWEKSCMDIIGEVAVLTSPADSACQVNHSVPAVIFSTGGYTGNVYHEFNDGLIPLFITSQRFQGEVVYMILELHDWWMMKYGSVVRKLSKYPVIDFDKSQKVHCFPKVIVGLEIHDELSINSTLMEDGKSMLDFQRLLSTALSSPQMPSTVPRLQQMPTTVPRLQQMPRLVLISRKKSRVLINQEAVLREAKRLGFHVSVLSPTSHTELSEVYQSLQSADVVLGVHGAALTHLLFMRPGTVFIQIIPIGTDWAAYTYYGEPAKKAGLEYVEYRISPQESSLLKKYGRNHTAVTHPEKVAEQGWWEMKKIYLQDQDINLSLARFRPILRDVLWRFKRRQERVHFASL